MAKPKIACIVGTRPDAIKSAPVVLELRKQSEHVDVQLVSTGQHREMLEQALSTFGLQPDLELGIMASQQTLAQVSTRALEGIDRYLGIEKPDMVMVQGDTTTTFAAALASFYRQIPVGHIEAGLRTDNIRSPFPEEFNRRGIALMASLHFAPTTTAAKNLLSEGIDPSTIHVTGNTGIDALFCVRPSEQEWLPDHDGAVLLVTTHRRENWGEPQERIAKAVAQILEARPDTRAIVPMHMNPQVREVLTRLLGTNERIHLIEPPDFRDFVGLMRRATLILTDSGGVQEEAPTLAKPVLILRNTTERVEGIEAGVAKLVGTEIQDIVSSTLELLDDPVAYSRMANATSPYGDGNAAQRISEHVLNYFNVAHPAEQKWT